MKAKRSERLVEMTYYLLEHPFEAVPLTYFSKLYTAAKSSISEDLGIIKERFNRMGIGDIETFIGARGGVRYLPYMTHERQRISIEELVQVLDGSQRLLPGDFVYLSDILSQPRWLQIIGHAIASQYEVDAIDTVMTVATSGVPIAQSVASVLNVPFTIVTRDAQITEGSTVSVNYVSGRGRRQVETMSLAKRRLETGARVLVVDDCMRSGGTIEGMHRLLNEFDAELVGSIVVIENIVDDVTNRTIDYQSLMKVHAIDPTEETIQVELGSVFNTTEDTD